MATPLRILFIDLEVAPLLAHIWSAKTDYVWPDAIISDKFLLAWGAKWAHQTRIMAKSLHSQEAKDQDDSRIVRELGNLVRKADVVVSHNSDGYDIPVLTTRLLLLGEEPLGPTKTVDTLKIAKRQLVLASNSLNYVARALGIEGKKHKLGMPGWRRAFMGDAKALQQMVRYTRQDVVVLEQIYEALKPYAKGIPRLVDAEYDKEHVCPFCGSEHLQRRGFYRTNASTFQKWQCQVCLKWSRSRTGEKTRVANVPL